MAEQNDKAALSGWAKNYIKEAFAPIPQEAKEQSQGFDITNPLTYLPSFSKQEAINQVPSQEQSIQDANLTENQAKLQSGEKLTMREPAAPSPSLMKSQAPALPNYFAGQGDLAKAQQMAELGATKEAEAYQYKAEQGEKIRSDYTKEMTGLEAKHQQERDEFERKGNEYEHEIETFKIDPNKMWANMSTGNKVLAGLSIFLGGFDPSGQNKALGIIDNAINRDIDAQKAQYAKLRDKKQDLNSLYGRMMDKFKDEKIALEMARAGHFQSLGMKVENLAAQAKVPQIKAQYLQQSAVLKQKAAEAASQGALKLLEAQQKSSELSVPGFQGVAKSLPEATKLRDKAARSETAIKGLEKLVSFANLGSKASKEDIAAAGALSKMLTSAVKDPVVGEGTISNPDRELIAEVVVDPTRFFSLPSQDKIRLETAIQQIKQDIYHSAKYQGLVAPNFFTPKTDFSKQVF